MDERVEVWNHGDILINLICERNIKTFVEVGVHKGNTSKRILNSIANNVLEKYFAIDQWDYLDTWPITQKDWNNIYKNACKKLLYFKKMQIIKLPSVEAATLFWKEYFDMVYIDADHEYQSVIDDIKAWLPLIKKGGIIAGHDYVYRDGKGRRAICEVKPAVDDFFGKKNIIKEKHTIWIKEL